MKNVSKKMKLILWTRNSIGILVMLGIVLTLWFSLKGNIRFILVLISGIIFGLYSIFLIIYPILYYKRYTYYYDEQRICVSQGVVFQHRVVVPVLQIQDIHLFAGPVMQACRVTSLIVSTAGSVFVIKFLLLEDAKAMVEDLEKHLKSRIGEKNNEAVL